jgi:hypothetical protein
MQWTATENNAVLIPAKPPPRMTTLVALIGVGMFTGRSGNSRADTSFGIRTINSTDAPNSKQPTNYGNDARIPPADHCGPAGEDRHGDEADNRPDRHGRDHAVNALSA